MKRFIITALVIVVSSSIKGKTQRFKIAEGATIIIEKGDITQSKAQAIVNAANPKLLGGAGVCGAIFHAAGWNALQKACYQYPEHNGERCPVGKACITASFDLAQYGIQHIIHAVGPDCRIVRDEHQQNTLLEETYKNTLLLATQKGIQSIAFPFISSGIYAFPKERAAHIALATVVHYARNNKDIKAVHFVLWEQSDFDLFCTLIKQMSVSKFSFIAPIF